MKSLLLLGGGHAHAALLLKLIAAPLAGARITLVTPKPYQTYSGMLPGLVAGHYRPDEIQIDVAALARRAGAELVLGNAVALDAARRRVTLDDGRELAYDLASLNLGSLPNWFGVPGASEFAIPVKPYETFLAAWDALRADAAKRVLRIGVVGAGAGGVELALAMRFALAAGVVLFSDQPMGLPEQSPAAQRRIARLLSIEGVELRTNTRVVRVDAGSLTDAHGERESFDAIVWVAGAAAQRWLRESGLQVDKNGFVLVDDTLRSVSHQEVFAAGDSATLAGAPHPKSGVYAIRHAPVLDRNLRATLAGGTLERYVAQKEALALITIGRKYCLAVRGGWALEGAWLWRVKDWIDRRWIKRFE